ncbi:MAG TPA: phosphatase PAP2 family protein [Hyphomicrobiaceae bacterium]|nr:phosphatase PAP2 family protein [Hyphomicrobiaceae bacterium]
MPDVLRVREPHVPVRDWHLATDELQKRLTSAFLVLAILLAVMMAIGQARYGDWRAMDQSVFIAINTVTGGVAAAPAWFSYLARDLTSLGGVTVLSLLVTSIIGFLLLRGHRRTAVALLAITVSGWLMSHALKIAIARPRPDLVPHGMIETTASFPSGHSFVSMVVYVTLGAMLARVEADRRVRAYLFYLALAVSIVIGTTRIFLGVHWPSDVIGGWMLGLLWVIIGMRVFDAVVRRNPPPAAA